MSRGQASPTAHQPAAAGELSTTPGAVNRGTPAIGGTPVLRRVSPPAATPRGTPVLAGAPFTVLRRTPMPGSGFVAHLVAGEGSLYALSCGGTQSAPRCAVTRLDPQSGRVGPQAAIGGAISLAFANGQLWVARGTRASNAQQHVAPSLVALDPATLAIRKSVALPAAPGGLALAGGEIWIAGRSQIYAVDPRTGAVAHTVPVSAGSSQPDYIVIAASADGSALWTAVGNAAGGAIPVQLRDPSDGHVIAEDDDAAGGIGPVSLAAAGDHGWLGYATGMLGSYVRVTEAAGRLVETPPVGLPPTPFANGISTHLADGQLWLLDGMSGSVACARDSTGQILARTRLMGIDDALAPLAGGQLAIAVGNEVSIVQPQPVCGP